MRRWIFWAALVVAVGIPAGMLWWRARRERSLAEYLQEVGFKPLQSPCPGGDRVVDRPDQVECWRGELKPGISVTFLVAERWRPGYTPRAGQVAKDLYVGLLVPDQGEQWLAGWRGRVAASGAGAPLRVTAGEAGVMLTWEGVPTRDFVAARLREARDSMQ